MKSLTTKNGVKFEYESESVAITVNEKTVLLQFADLTELLQDKGKNDILSFLR
jgi:carbonic anhydrase